MRMVVLGVVVALGAGLTGVLSASATPMMATAIDEAAGAVSLMTKTISASSKQFGHYKHHHRHSATAKGSSQGGGKAQTKAGGKGY